MLNHLALITSIPPSVQGTETEKLREVLHLGEGFNWFWGNFRLFSRKECIGGIWTLKTRLTRAVYVISFTVSLLPSLSLSSSLFLFHHPSVNSSFWHIPTRFSYYNSLTTSPFAQSSSSTLLIILTSFLRAYSSSPLRLKLLPRRPRILLRDIEKAFHSHSIFS